MATAENETRSADADGDSARSADADGGSARAPKRQRAPRRREAIAFVENDKARQLSFSKRRRSLYKKAMELSILTGSRISIAIATKTGRFYRYEGAAEVPIPNVSRPNEYLTNDDYYTRFQGPPARQTLSDDEGEDSETPPPAVYQQLAQQPMPYLPYAPYMGGFPVAAPPANGAPFAMPGWGYAPPPAAARGALLSQLAQLRPDQPGPTPPPLAAASSAASGSAPSQQ